MAEIVGTQNLTRQQIQMEIQKGAKFVIFQYSISILIMSFRRSSAIHFVKNGESTFMKGLPYTLISLFLGWWGIPWGPIYTIQALSTNLQGGRDVTALVYGKQG